MPIFAYRKRGCLRLRGFLSPAAGNLCLVSILGLLLALPLDAHQIEKPTGNLLFNGSGGQDYIYVNDSNGCVADFITASSNDPSLFQVAALDMATKQIGPFGATAIAFNRIDQVFVVRASAPVDTTGVGSGQVTVCWQESGAAPCNENNCATGVNVDVTVLRDQQTDGALDFAADGGDPINTGSGGLYIPHRRLIDLGGPMPLRFTIYYDSNLFSDQLIGLSGFNWLTNFDWYLLPAGNNRNVMTPRGRLIRFEKGFFDTTWTVQPRREIPFQLIEDGSDFIFVDPRDQRIYTFNEFGELQTIEDGRGNTHTIISDFAGRVSTVSDGLGRQLTFTYTFALSSVTDGTRTISFGFTGNDVTTINDAAGNPTTYTYEPLGLGLMTSETRPEGNTPYTQTWDDRDRVTSQTDAYGNESTVSYDDAAGERTYQDPFNDSQITSYGDRYTLKGYTDDMGASATVGSDSVGRRDELIDREGGTTVWTYNDNNGKIESVTNADGKTTTYQYTSRTLGGIDFYDLTGVNRPDGSSESFTYDAFGRLDSWTDGESKTWIYGHDSNGQITSITNPEGGVSTNSWNPDGTLDFTVDPATNQIDFEYDALKRPTKITHPGGSFRTFVYDDRDLLTSNTNEENETTALGYDLNGNLTSVTSPLNLTTTFNYDLLDRLQAITNHLGHTDSVSFDKAGRVAKLTDAVGNTNVLGRDSRGYVTSITDGEGKTWLRSVDDEGIMTGFSSPLGKNVTVSSDDMGRITGTTSHMGNTVGVAYDELGRVVQITDALNRVIDATRDGRGLISQIDLPMISSSYLRNGFGQITQITDPRGNPWQYGYDNSARLTSKTDPLGQTTTYGHDTRNRRSLATFPGGMGSVTYSYDDANRLTGLAYSDGTNLSFVFDDDSRLTAASGIALGYDDADRITSCNGLTMTWDPAGRLSSLTLGAGKIVTFSYDGRNLPVTVTDWVGGVTTLTYDNDWQINSIARPNGVTSTYGYDDDGRLFSIQHGGLGDILIARDDAGQIISSTRNLPSIAVPAAVAQSLTFDDANQVNGYSYDSMGRLESDGTNNLTWDLASRVTTLDQGGDPITFSYDAMGRVLTRTKGGQTREFVSNYATGIPVVSVERISGTGDHRYYIHTPGGYLLHSVDASDDSRHFYHEDEMGNTVFLTNDAGGVTDSYAYDPFGVPLTESGTTENRFTWGGLYGAMREGGLYRIGARFYNPAESRWILRDPITGLDPRSVNPYQANFGNPALYVDPLGTEPLIAIKMLVDYLNECYQDYVNSGPLRFTEKMILDRVRNRNVQLKKVKELQEIEKERWNREQKHRKEANNRLAQQRENERYGHLEEPRTLPLEVYPALSRACGAMIPSVVEGDLVDPEPSSPSMETKQDPNLPPRQFTDPAANPYKRIIVVPIEEHEYWWTELLRGMVPNREVPQADPSTSPDTYVLPPSAVSPRAFMPSAPFEAANLRALPRKLGSEVEGPHVRDRAGAEIKGRKRFP